MQFKSPCGQTKTLSGYRFRSLKLEQELEGSGVTRRVLERHEAMPEGFYAVTTELLIGRGDSEIQLGRIEGIEHR